MGGFYGSVHLKTDDRQSVVDVLTKLAKRSGERFLVGPVVEGWVAVYPSTSGQDEGVSRRIARRTRGDVVHLISHDEDVFLYFVYRDGRLLDRYSSDPDFSGNLSRAVRRKFAGRPVAFGHLFASPAQIDAARQILDAPDLAAGSSGQMVQFAKCLGLSGDVMTSYDDLREGDGEDVEHWDQFIHVPDLSKKLAQERRAAAEVAGRKNRLMREGVLLVERVNVRPGKAMGHPLVTPDQARGFWVCAEAGYGGGVVPVERFGPPWSHGPVGPILTVEADLWALETSPSGRYLLVSQGVRENWRVEVWDMSSTRLVKTVRLPPGLDWYGFLPDESGWVGVSPKHVVVARLEGDAEPTLWTIEHGTHAAIHPSGATLVLGDRRNRLVFVDLATGRVVKRLLTGGPSKTSGLGVLARFVPAVGEAMKQAAEGLDLADLAERIKRRQADAAATVPEDVVVSGRVWHAPPDQELARLKAVMQARLVEAFTKERAGQTPLARMFGFVPDVRTPEQLDALVAGATPTLCLGFDAEGDWLCCGTDTGLQVFSWRDLLASDSATPPPRFSVDASPFVDDFDAGLVTKYHHVCDVTYDAAAGRFLFPTMGGQVGFVQPSDGTSGVLLDVPGRPPILKVRLSRDRGALCISCHPDRFGRLRARHRPFVQIWNYTALERNVRG
ncbi:MAG: hypothetical protein P4L84_21615 [Isosphaeraceae bacterium]|nr:hypothetical protein [Isosphaeraceae bacterium]